MEQPGSHRRSVGQAEMRSVGRSICGNRATWPPARPALGHDSADVATVGAPEPLSHHGWSCPIRAPHRATLRRSIVKHAPNLSFSAQPILCGAIYAPTRNRVGAPFNNRHFRYATSRGPQSATCGGCLRVLRSMARSRMRATETISDSRRALFWGRNCSPQRRLGREQLPLVNRSGSTRSMLASPLRPTVCAGASPSIGWLGFSRAATRERFAGGRRCTSSTVDSPSGVR